MVYKVIYDYKPNNPGDITLHKNDCVQNVKDVGYGWVIGHNFTTGETGHFPAEYIQCLPSFIPSSTHQFHNITIDTENDEQVATTPQGTQEHNLRANNSSLKKNHNAAISIAKENLTIGIHNLKSNLTPKAALGRFSVRINKIQKQTYLKALLGILSGLLLSLAIFLALYYSFQYSILVAGTISVISGLLLCIGLAVSSRCRCIVLLVFPSLATGKGRTAFLSVITGLLLAGPVTNITHNANEVAVTMACFTELAYNQSEALQDKLQEPIEALRDQVKRGVNAVKDYGQSIDKAFAKIKDVVNTAEETINSALKEISGFKNRCEQSLNTGFAKCQRDSRRLKADCQKTLNPISSVTVLTVGTAVNSFINNVGKLFGKKRKRRYTSCSSKHCSISPKRKKRSALGQVCDIFTLGHGVCSGINSLGICNIVTLPEHFTKEVFRVSKQLIDAYSGLFDVGVKNSGSINNAANSSRTTSQIVDNIKSDLKSKIDNTRFIISVLNRVMSLSLVLLILNAFLYERNYRCDISFDNIYITSNFKQIDQKEKENGNQTVLPLNKKERNIYTDSKSVKMSSMELGKCKIGLVQVLLHSVICIMLIVFDNLLHYLLYLLHKYGDVTLTFTGQSNLNIEITGRGIMAAIFKILANDISVSQAYNSTVDVNVCLPEPREPDIRQIYVFLILYVFAVLLVVLQCYGQRLLHSIAAMFYPKREEKRIKYLYRKILAKRKTFLQEVKEILLSKKEENGTDEINKMTSDNYVTRLIKKVPFCRKYINISAQPCKNCGENSEDMYSCNNNNCSTVLCTECFTDVGKMCPMCAEDIEETNK